MSSRDHTFAVALVASILAHAAIVFVIAEEAVRATGGDQTVNPRPAEVAYAGERVVRPPPEDFEKLLFGDAKGTGDAANARRGDELMIAPREAEAAAQAFLSRDPVGPGEIFKEAPSMSVLPTGSAAVATAEFAPPPPSPIVPFGVGEVRRVAVPHVTRAAKPTPPSPPPTAGADRPGVAGVPQPAADPAVMSDSESDPFGKRASKDAVEFRDGRVEARFGRKVKTVRPFLSLASQFDLMGMQSPRMVVRIHVHGDGSVRKVDVVQSSGSASADQEVKIALYQWWFEPAREDVVEFPITWR